MRAKGFFGLLVAAALVLIAAATAAALFGTGVIGGKTTEPESAFVQQLNDNVLIRLGEADQVAADHASLAADVFVRSPDGNRIVQVTEDARTYLQTLTGISGREKGQVRLLLTLVDANERYGQALAAFSPADHPSVLTLAGAAKAAHAAIATVQSGLPADLRLPPTAAFASLRGASPPPPSTTTNTSPSAPHVAVAYVQQVDGLLSGSHGVALASRAFIRRATGGAISRSHAVTISRSFVAERRLELVGAQGLTVPPAFAPAQRLLIGSLAASVANDQALVAWTVARRAGSGNAQAAINLVNRIGAHATVLKRRFLRVYAQQRKAATGRSPATLPVVF